MDTWFDAMLTDEKMAKKQLSAMPELLYKRNTIHQSMIKGVSLYLFKLFVMLGTTFDQNSQTLLCARDQKDWTFLHYAAKYDRMDHFAYVVANCARRIVFMQGWKQDNILHVALRYKSTRIVNWLLDNEPSLSNIAMKYNRTPLHIAVWGNEKYYVQRLVALHKTHVMCEDDFHSTPLVDAVEQDMLSLVEIMLDANPDAIATVHQRYGSLLHVVQSIQMAEYLLQKHPKLAMSKDGNGRTALHRATLKDKGELVKIFLLRFPELMYIGDFTNKLPFAVAVEKECIDAMLVMLQINPLYQYWESGWGSTLHLVARHSTDVALVSAVYFANETHISQRTVYGTLPLDYALKRKDACKDVVNFLTLKTSLEDAIKSFVDANHNLGSLKDEITTSCVLPLDVMQIVMSYTGLPRPKKRVFNFT